MKRGWEGSKKSCGPQWAYLIRVHFELADNLDGDFLSGFGVSGTVDVGEGTVAHLFDQEEAFQTRVARHFAGLLSLLGNDSFDFWISGILLDFLIFSLRLSGGMVGLGSDVTVVPASYGELSWIVGASLVMLLLLVAEVWLADAMVIFLLLNVNRRDICGGLVAGPIVPLGLFAMSEEVLDILYGRHVFSFTPR